MELQFEKRLCRCLETVIREVQNQEQTREIKLPEGMPDVGTVIGAWGQVIVRGKEWRGDSVAVSGGIMAWVLYTPEDAGPVRCLDAWIPFQMKWNLPRESREGELRIQCLLRSADARSVSPRKIMVRCSVAAQIQALTPMEAELWEPEKIPADVELLKNTYPVRLPRETGEKAFLLDEELDFPDSGPAPQKLLFGTLHPKISEKKVMSNKVVFRGTGNLRVLYCAEDGRVCSRSFELPFSQLAELTGEYSPEAQAALALCVTNLDMELTEGGLLRLRAGLVGQYLVDDRQLLTLTQDAYSPERTVEPSVQPLLLPALLDSCQETLTGEAAVNADGAQLADAVFLPDFPRQRLTDTGITLEMTGQFQLLYYEGDGTLRGAVARWEGTHSIPQGEDCSLALDMPVSQCAQVSDTGEGQCVKSEITLGEEFYGGQGLTVVTALELGEPEPKNPARPSLILRRCRGEGLWHIAKGTGSTVAAIRAANGLEGEPEDGRMLLIPVV